MSAVIPKGFEIVPDERLPTAPGMTTSPELAAEPEEGAQIGTASDGRPVIRRYSQNPQGERLSFDMVVDEDGSEQMYGEISGTMGGSEEPALPEELGIDAPEGFEGGEEAEEEPEAERPDYSLLGSPELGAAASGFKSGVTMGFDDELQAAAGTLANKVGTLFGANDSTASAKDIFNAMLEERRNVKDAAYDEQQLSYGAGALPGMLLSAPAIGGRIAQGTTAVRNTLNLAGAGARAGAVSGAGNNEGDLVDLVANTAEGAGIGAVAAPLLQPVIGGIVRGGGAIRNAVAPRNTLDSGLEQLARRADQDPAAMAARAAEMQSGGVDPRLVDVVDESGRGVIRAAGGRMTPAREELAQHADQVYVDAQDRVAQQARDVISAQPLTARQMSARIAEEQTAMGPAFDAVRSQPVGVTSEMVRAFSTPEGRSSLRMIGRYMTPDERQSLDGFISAVNGAARQLDPRLPPAIRAQIERQLFAQTPLTVDIVDKFARIITNRAVENPALMRVAKNYAETVRGAARTQHPEYGQALDEFAGRARVADAADGTGRFENTDFLNSAPDQFAEGVAAASIRPTALANEGGAPAVSEADALTARARDAVVDRATSGSGANAMGVARQLARGSAQDARNRALLGDLDADRLAAGMGAEVRRVDNTRFVDPRTGSQTASREADMGEAGMDAAFNVASGGKWAVVRSAAQFLRNVGIRGVDAERLVRDSIDPARTQDAIRYLTERGMEISRARGMVRNISAAMGGRAGGAISYDGSPEGQGQPRTSARSIVSQSRQLDHTGE